MFRLICLLVPGLIMAVLREKLFHSHENLYKSICVYMLDVLILNLLMFLILYFIFDNHGNPVFMLQDYRFAFKYISLAAVMGIFEPFAEKYIRKGSARLLPAVQDRLQGCSRTRNILWKTALSLAIVLVFVVIGSFKAGYHEDEMYTMGLSNHQYNGSIGPSITDGEVYTGLELWQDYTMVSDSNRFDYANVLENQRNDVHPPLYYIIIHTVFSLFPNTYSIWYVLAVNILLAVIVFWQMVWLFTFFTKKPKLSVLFSLLFLFTMGFVNNVMFLRMYVLLTIWTNALIMLFCKYRPADRGWKFYALLVFILTGGTMTQYYFLIFAFFACAVYAVRTIAEKEWKKLALSCASAALSFGISTFLFPSMWTQIFKGSRGQEAFANLSADGFWDALQSYLSLINLHIFGGLFLFLFFFTAALLIIASGKRKQEHTKETLCNYLQLAAPAAAYVLLVAKIAPYQTERYVMNILGILYLLVFSALIQVSFCYSRQAVAGIAAIALVISFSSYQNGIPCQYTSVNNRLEKVESLGDDVPCLYIYQSPWMTLADYVVLEDLNEIVFVKSDHLDLLEEDAYKNYSRVLLFVSSSANADQLISQLLEQNPQLDSSKTLFKSNYATAYYLE
ncbi:MAG: hypothetical protein LIO76_04235 [Clostridiales bacterium]|nr:hypothetical protein [Clostridiales bacterium]